MNKTQNEETEKLSVYKTSDYSIFEPIPGNRPISLTGDIRRAQKKSLYDHGWFKHEPAKCVLHGGRMHTVDGNHRIEMAKGLKIPVYFIVLDISYTEACELMVELQAGKSWCVSDYCNKYVRENEDYRYAIEFAKNNRISISQSLGLNAGEMAAIGNIADKIKSGKYVPKNKAYANRVIAIRDTFCCCKEITNTNGLLKACAKLAHVGEFSLPRLQEKIDKYSYMAKNQGSADGFLEMIDTLYNYHNSTKIPLFFLVKETMKRRSAAFCDPGRTK